MNIWDYMVICHNDGRPGLPLSALLHSKRICDNHALLRSFAVPKMPYKSSNQSATPCRYRIAERETAAMVNLPKEVESECFDHDSPSPFLLPFYNAWNRHPGARPRSLLFCRHPGGQASFVAFCFRLPARNLRVTVGEQGRGGMASLRGSAATDPFVPGLSARKQGAACGAARLLPGPGAARIVLDSLGRPYMFPGWLGAEKRLDQSSLTAASTGVSMPGGRLSR